MPQTERQLALRQALATLAPSVREALELTYFEGLTASEVALHMQTPEGTVRSRLARGLESLQRVLSLLEGRQP
jgi:RNA polymerase sigma-70 factor (ECF subfamily)